MTLQTTCPSCDEWSAVVVRANQVQSPASIPNSWRLQRRKLLVAEAGPPNCMIHQTIDNLLYHQHVVDKQAYYAKQCVCITVWCPSISLSHRFTAAAAAAGEFAAERRRLQQISIDSRYACSPRSSANASCWEPWDEFRHTSTWSLQ